MPPKQSTGASATAALAHSSNSVRAKSKQVQDSPRKTVFRPVLDNPLSIAWPPLPAHIRQLLLEALLTFLNTTNAPHEPTIADWRLEEHARKRGRTAVKADQTISKPDGAQRHRKRSAEDDGSARPRKRAKTTAKSAAGASVDPAQPRASPGTAQATNDPSAKPAITKANKSPAPRPRLLDHMCFGINEVTRALEARIRWGRWELGDAAAAPGSGLAASTVAEAKRFAEAETETKIHKRRNRRILRRDKKRDSDNQPSAISPTHTMIAASSSILSHPSYGFLSHHASSLDSGALPPFLLPPSDNHSGFRLLANTHSVKSLAASKSKSAKGASGLPAPSTATLPTAAAQRKGVETDKEKNNITAAAISSKAVSHLLATQIGVPLPPLDMPEPDTVPLIDLIFVCKPDINPPSLVAHLPMMAAAANGVKQALDERVAAAEEHPDKMVDDATASKETGDGTAAVRPSMRQVMLVPLDIGAERKLADALALRRVASIGLSSSAPGIEPLVKLVDKYVKPLEAAWLVPHLAASSAAASLPVAPKYIPTHIKHLRSSAPLNPKAANTAKKEARRQKKDALKQGVYIAQDD